MKTKTVARTRFAVSLTLALSAFVILSSAFAQAPPDKLTEIEKQIRSLQQAVEEIRRGREPQSTPPGARPSETPSSNRTAAAASASRTNDPIARIRDEGLNRSQVMQTLSYLTDVIGPRLTGSPNLKRANEWTRDKLVSWGLSNAKLEAWGPFGRGWSLERFSAQIVEPYAFPLIGAPKAWTPGFKEPITAEVVFLDARTESDLEKYKGKLKGAIVLTSPPREVRARFEPLAVRISETNLLRMANSAGSGSGGGRRGATPPSSPPVTGRRGGAGSGGAYLGILGSDAEGGVRLTEVVENGPAAKAGIMTGDLVTAVSGKAIQNYDQLVAEIRARKTGEKLKVKFLRDGQPQELEATLAERPAAVPTGGQFGFQGRVLSFIQQEEAALAVSPSSNGDGGTFFIAQASMPSGSGRGGFGAQRPSPWLTNATPIPAQITLAVEDYNRLVRMIQQGEKLKMAVELKAKFHEDDFMAYNTVAEISGSDLKDELVMIGAHLDSWHSGTGATDNGAGVAATMEAVRILQALKLEPRRTVRIALWTGEEQGLLGSKAYVAQQFGYYTNVTSRSESGSSGEQSDGNSASQPAPGSSRSTRQLVRHSNYEKFSAYFNLDNGTGKIRGVYLQGNETVRPLFRRWLQPFNDLGAETLTLNNTSGTDHLSFDEVGLPGFQFIQDPVEYPTRTHHSNQDVFDRIQADDIKQAATIMAAFLYHASTMDEKLPRKPTE